MKFYLCDRKKCENCKPECCHTSDFAHALHPDAPDENFLPLLSEGAGAVDLFEQESSIEKLIAKLEL